MRVTSRLDCSASRAIDGGAASTPGHAVAIARTLACLLDDAIARDDARTAADVAAQLAEEIERLGGGR